MLVTLEVSVFFSSSIFLAFHTDQFRLVFYQFLFECFIRIQLFASVDQKHIPRTHLVGVNQVAINELLNDVVRFYIECILLSSFLQSLDADLDLLLIHISQVDGVNDSVGSQNCFFLDLLSVVVENEPFRGDVQLGGYHFSKLVSPHLLGKFDAFSLSCQKFG
jgi:hypothetical protein